MFHLFERLVDPYPEVVPDTPPRGFFTFMWACTAGMRRYIAAMTLFTAGIGAFEAVLFAMLGSIVDWLSHVPRDRLWSDERSRLLLLAGILAASWSWWRCSRRSSSRRCRATSRCGCAGTSTACCCARACRSTGRVRRAHRTKVMQTALAVRDTWMTVCDILVFIVIYFVTLLAVVGSFHLGMLLPMLGWLGLYLLTLRHFVPRLSRVSKVQADARSLMTGRITDAYTNIATVKLFAHDLREAAHARSAMQEYLHTVHAQMRLVTGFEIVIHALSMALILATAGAALALWMRGEVGIGAVAAATAMALRLNGISHWIMWEMATLFEHIGTVQDGIGTLSRAPIISDAPDASALRVERGEIRFDDVSFGYAGGPRVIEHFDLTIRPGEKIGLVGRSGAGKSTIVNLLLRFHDLPEGRIRIDGTDIAHVTQDSLRAQVGMVTQDTSLLHRSVRDNILYGRPDAGDEAMIAAARRAEAHEFILGLTDPAGRRGYDAHVGERGVKLSGGQRQRIAIARVMLKNAPILLLDEATSALDSEVEAAIQASLYRLMEGKTVVAIAHRLSTIAAMDRLVVMDRGRIVEQGDHRTLLVLGGLYARLWAHQSGGFLGEDDEEPGRNRLSLSSP
jgi:ATP-binding cassette subfamily B multidrug efflux pump